MANKIKIEGQTINGESVGITDEIANDDELLKAALAPAYPGVRSAEIEREGGIDGKELVVTVIKKAGTKGALIERLLAAPVGVNPAVEMSRRVREMARAGELDPARVKKLLPKINRAIETGDRDLHAAREALRDLLDAGAVASKEVPLGF
jgi:hypothetical protein